MTPARFQTEYLSQAATFYRVAFYILEDATEAEDAVQELFLRLWNGRDALDGIRNPAGYGIRVLRNLCLDRIRRSRKMETPAVLPEAMDEQERLAKVLDAIKSLPERQREVLTLRTLDGLSYEEISERTGINYLTLRVLLSQARRKLRYII